MHIPSIRVIDSILVRVADDLTERSNVRANSTCLAVPTALHPAANLERFWKRELSSEAGQA